MERELIHKFRLALGIDRRVVGIKFLFIQEEYDDCPAEEIKNKFSFCGLTAQAMKGKNVKGKYDSFGCQGGPEMLGMKPVPNYVRSGKQFASFRLYEDMAIARQVQRELCFVDQKIYGVFAGPLEEMEDADVVMFICNAWQMMRVVQGYTYHHGMAKNIGMIGNQGICSDLVSRPYVMNDLNISLLCAGARLNTKAGDGELGAGMPVHLFWDVVRGVLATVNPSMENRRKEELECRLDRKDELGFELEYGKMYTSYAKEGAYEEELYKKELF